MKQRVLNRELHVGRGELRDDRAVDVLDHRMHDGLRVNEDVDLIDVRREEVMRLDDFQPFVHHRGGVDRDLVAHLPRRMCERRVDGDVGECGEVAAKERAARSGEDDAGDFAIGAGAQRLMHRVVFGIDGKDFAAVLACGPRHHITRGNEHFFVRDRDAFAAHERRVHRRDAGRADDRRDHAIRRIE